MAQRALGNCLTKGRELFNFRLSLEDENATELMYGGWFYALPKRDALGRLVIVCSCKGIDVNKHTFGDLQKISAILSFVISENEENQIKGIVLIFDLAELSMTTVLWAGLSQCIELGLVGQVPRTNNVQQDY